MKKILAAVVLLLFVAAPVMAADTITLKAKNGDVTLNHKVHGEKYGCKACHPEATPAKLSLAQGPGAQALRRLPHGEEGRPCSEQVHGMPQEEMMLLP